VQLLHILIHSRILQVAVITGLVGAAVIVWVVRQADPTEAVLAGDSVPALFESLWEDFEQYYNPGEVCVEEVSSLADAAGAKPHGLAEGAPLPSALTDKVVERFDYPINDYSTVVYKADRILLVRRAVGYPTEGDTSIALILEVSFLTGGTAGVDRWEVTELAALHYCGPSRS